MLLSFSNWTPGILLVLLQCAGSRFLSKNGSCSSNKFSSSFSQSLWGGTTKRTYKTPAQRTCREATTSFGRLNPNPKWRSLADLKFNEHWELESYSIIWKKKYICQNITYSPWYNQSIVVRCRTVEPRSHLSQKRGCHPWRWDWNPTSAAGHPNLQTAAMWRVDTPGGQITMVWENCGQAIQYGNNNNKQI